MAKERVLTLLFRLLVMPVTAISEFSYFTNIRGFRRDVHTIVAAVDASASFIPIKFAAVLFVAEDHRSQLHPGVDPIALGRAVWVWLRWRRRQGASTVEQQFVRTILRMYAPTFLRKFREQLLAVAVSRRRSKTDIARAYLAVAYYGTKYRGTAGLKALCGSNLESARPEQIRGAVARLKYPEPRNPTVSWAAKHHRRIEYLVLRQTRFANHCSGPLPTTRARLPGF